MNIKQQFKEGLITNNPVLVQLIGMCATMAITTSLFNGIGMGLSVLIILTCCNVVISLIRKVIPNDIRLAIFVLVIASFVTIVDLVLQAYVPALSASLGVFIPLIVVNCIIIGRAEAFCQKNPVGPSFFDGIFQGLGYTLVLIAMCVIRELLGKGSFGTGIFNGFRTALLYGMIGDTVEYGQWKTGVRADGLCSSGTSFMLKLGGAIAPTMLLAMLAANGYAEGAATQTAGALSTMNIVMNLVPAILAAISFLLFVFYKLDAKLHAQIIQDLKDRGQYVVEE